MRRGGGPLPLWVIGPPLLASQFVQVGASSVTSRKGWQALHLWLFNANTWSQNFAKTPMAWGLRLLPRSLTMLLLLTRKPSNAEKE